MASSGSGQDEPNRVMWLATRTGKMEPSCPLGTTRCIPQEKFPRKPYNKSFIDQVCLVKMAKQTWTITQAYLYFVSIIIIIIIIIIITPQFFHGTCKASSQQFTTSWAIFCSITPYNQKTYVTRRMAMYCTSINIISRLGQTVRNIPLMTSSPVFKKVCLSRDHALAFDSGTKRAAPTVTSNHLPEVSKVP